MKVRDANMDLMRITAMLLVMFFHDNFYSIAVEEGSITGFPSSHIFGFALMKCISMVCVNMFILISGWYGIRPTLKKFFEMHQAEYPIYRKLEKGAKRYFGEK